MHKTKELYQQVQFCTSLYTSTIINFAITIELIYHLILHGLYAECNV
jgi:hypothetical protein